MTDSCTQKSETWLYGDESNPDTSTEVVVSSPPKLPVKKEEVLLPDQPEVKIQSIDDVDVDDIDGLEDCEDVPEDDVSKEGSQFGDEDGRDVDLDNDDEDDDDDINVITAPTSKSGVGVAVVQQNKQSALATVPKITKQGIDLDDPGNICGLPTLDFDIGKLSENEKPWKRSGADVTDHFNFGFTEDSWLQHCEKHRNVRQQYAGTALMPVVVGSVSTRQRPLRNLGQSGGAITALGGFKTLPTSAAPPTSAPPAAKTSSSPARPSYPSQPQPQEGNTKPPSSQRTSINVLGSTAITTLGGGSLQPLLAVNKTEEVAPRLREVPESVALPASSVGSIPSLSSASYAATGNPIMQLGTTFNQPPPGFPPVASPAFNMPPPGYPPMFPNMGMPPPPSMAPNYPPPAMMREAWPPMNMPMMGMDHPSMMRPRDRSPDSMHSGESYSPPPERYSSRRRGGSRQERRAASPVHRRERAPSPHHERRYSGDHARYEKSRSSRKRSDSREKKVASSSSSRHRRRHKDESESRDRSSRTSSSRKKRSRRSPEVGGEESAGPVSPLYSRRDDALVGSNELAKGSSKK